MALVARFCLDRPANALRRISDPLTANDSAGEAGVSCTSSVCSAGLPRQHVFTGVCCPLGFLAETDSSPRFVGGFCIAWACRHICKNLREGTRQPPTAGESSEIGPQVIRRRQGAVLSRLPRSARSGGTGPLPTPLALHSGAPIYGCIRWSERVFARIALYT